jgi:hypothetical protein
VARKPATASLAVCESNEAYASAPGYIACTSVRTPALEPSTDVLRDPEARAVLQGETGVFLVSKCNLLRKGSAAEKCSPAGFNHPNMHVSFPPENHDRELSRGYKETSIRL